MLPIFLHHTIKNGNVQERTDRNILNILTGISRIFLPKIIKIRQEKGCFLIRMLYVISYVQVFRCLPVWNEYCNNCHCIQTNWFDAGQQQIWTSALAPLVAIVAAAATTVLLILPPWHYIWCRRVVIATTVQDKSMKLSTACVSSVSLTLKHSTNASGGRQHFNTR